MEFFFLFFLFFFFSQVFPRRKDAYQSVLQILSGSNMHGRSTTNPFDTVRTETRRNKYFPCHNLLDYTEKKNVKS